MIYVVLSLWDGDAIDPAPVATYRSKAQANAACRRYVQDAGTSYDPDVMLDHYTDHDGLSTYECEVRGGLMQFSARVFELDEPRN